MNKRLKGCLLGCAGFIALVVLGVYGFISWFKYTSPVLEAGREYTQQVKSYQGEVVTSKAELNERLEILDEHFESPTFDKMQGGKKTERMGALLIGRFFNTTNCNNYCNSSR